MSKLSALSKYTLGSLDAIEIFSVQRKCFINTRYDTYSLNNVCQFLMDTL